MLAQTALPQAALVAGRLLAEDKPNPVLPKTPEIIVALVVFGILFLLLRRSAYPRFEQVYRQRTEAIEGGIARAEQAQAEAKAALEQYRAQLADARAESARIIEKARSDGQAIVEGLRGDAQRQAADLVARAERQIEADRQRAFAELRQEIGRLSVQLAERVVGESLADRDLQSRVVDRFLGELEQRPQEPVR